jgi:hypothetical protein
LSRRRPPTTVAARSAKKSYATCFSVAVDCLS